MTDPQSGVRLKQTRRFDAEFSAIAGFAAVVVLLMNLNFVARGDWSGLWFWMLPIGMVLIGKISLRLLAENFVVLYPDRMEFPHRRGQPSIVMWAAVESIRWPKCGNDESKIQLAVPRASNRPFGKVLIDLQDVSRADGVTLIRYLRTAGAGLEQTGWPQFCRKRAIPLVERLQHKKELDTSGKLARFDRCLVFLNQFVPRWPFFGGVLCTLLMPFFLWMLVSRKMWWTLAFVIGISGVVNIRLIWGAWVSPFAEYWLGAMAVLIVAAAASPRDEKRPDGADTFSTTSVAAGLSVFIIGFPLLVNAMRLGWIWIPIPKEIRLLFLLLPCSLIFVVMLRQKRQEQRVGNSLDVDAMRRWDEFIATGILPEPGASVSTGQ